MRTLVGTRVPDLLDALRDGDLTVAASPDVATSPSALANQLASCSVVHFAVGWPFLGQEAVKQTICAYAGAGVMALPYPRFLLEVPAHTAMKEPFHRILDVAEVPGGYRFDMYAVAKTGPRRGDWRLMPGYVEVIGGKVCPHADLVLPARDQQATMDVLMKAAFVLLSYLALRDCPAVTTERQEAPEKLNRKRIAQRRSPVPPVHVVTVVLPKERSTRGAASPEVAGLELRAGRDLVAAR